jgi:hypothetical protein
LALFNATKEFIALASQDRDPVQNSLKGSQNGEESFWLYDRGDRLNFGLFSLREFLGIDTDAS